MIHIHDKRETLVIENASTENIKWQYLRIFFIPGERSEIL